MTSSSTVNAFRDAQQSTQHQSSNPHLEPIHCVAGPCLKLKGSLVPMTVLELSRYDAGQIEADLSAKTKQAPDFFKNLPVVIDLDKIDEHEVIPFQDLINQCLAFSIRVVAIRGGSDHHQVAAKKAGLGLLAKQKSKENTEQHTQNAQPEPSNRPSDNRPSETNTSQKPSNETVTSTEKTEVTKTVVKNKRQQSKVVHHPIRSGQQVYAAEGDLIVLSSVSAGAEILADGNIHVYGSLRGRALAGVKGDTSARIFCHRLQAELVSIAGQYKISEDINKSMLGKPTQIFLENDTLSFKELDV